MLNILQQDISISFSLLIISILNFNFLATPLFKKKWSKNPGEISVRPLYPLFKKKWPEGKKSGGNLCQVICGKVSRREKPSGDFSGWFFIVFTRIFLSCFL